MMTLKIGHEYVGTITAVPDGDGLEIYSPLAMLRLRLRHIDAPEDGQPYATQAQRLLKSLCFEKLVWFRISKWDCYGRAIADVRLRDGRDLSRILVSAGLAWWYRKYSRNVYIGQLEQQARRIKRGLWRDPNPTPPWEFRKAKKLRTRKRC